MRLKRKDILLHKKNCLPSNIKIYISRKEVVCLLHDLMGDYLNFIQSRLILLLTANTCKQKIKISVVRWSIFKNL